MYNCKRFAVLIPARKSSKAVPRKNIALCAGKPLISYTFEAALNCPYVDGIFCSSDDEQILQLAKKHHIECIRRPAKLAQDRTPMLDVLLHAKKYWKQKNLHFDYLILLQPTSPLRTVTDISKSIRQIIQDNTASLASVSAVALRAGLLLQGNLEGKTLRTRSLAPAIADLPRQLAPALYYVNGAVYIYKMNFLRPGTLLNAPQSAIVLPTSHTIDIDTPQDFKRCARALRRRRQTQRGK